VPSAGEVFERRCGVWRTAWRVNQNDTYLTRLEKKRILLFEKNDRKKQVFSIVARPAYRSDDLGRVIAYRVFSVVP
jgi:hypothetical protein